MTDTADFVDKLIRLQDKADEAFQANKFDAAEKHYLELLQLLESDGKSDSFEYCASLFNLATVYQKTQKVSSAAPLFSKLLSIEASNTTRVTPRTVQAAINLSHCYLKLGSVNRAEEASSKAIGLAQGCLPSDHPLIYKILDGQIEIMKAAGNSEATLKEAQGLLKEVKKGTVPLLQFTNLVEEAKAEVQASSEQEKSGRSKLRGLEDAEPRRGNPIKLLIVCSVALVALVATTIGALFVKSTDGKKAIKKIVVADAPKKNPYVGRMFMSCDHNKVLKIKNRETATWTIMASSTDVPVVVQSELSQDELPVRNVLKVTKIADDVVKDSDNSLLYSPEAKENVIINQMQLVAAAAKSYYMKRGTYPQDAAALELQEPKILFRNPFTQTVEEPACYKISTNLSGPDKDAKTIVQLSREGGPLSEDEDQKPGGLHYYLGNSTDGPLAIIRGCARDKQYLSGSHPGQACYAIVICKGYEWPEPRDISNFGGKTIIFDDGAPKAP